MNNIITKVVLSASFLGLLVLAAPTVSAPTVLAAPFSVASSTGAAKSEICQGLGSAGASCTSNQGSSISPVVSTVINVMSIIAGIIAVIMIIVGGMKYITSGGESSATASAKNTVLYALVGLVIVAMAQFLVHYVIGNA